MKGYKALNMDMSSAYGDMSYEIGKKYTITGKLVPCENGYHFCENLEDIEGYYTISDSRIFEVEAEGKIIIGENKICAESITLLRELSKEEIRQYFKDNQEQILTRDWHHRKALVDQGFCLDKLVYDEDFDVRKTVARQGYSLDILVNDKDCHVREAVAEQGYGLGILINDENWRVRAAVARQGYGLDILVHDEDWYVRAAVAEQGYGLDILVNDEDYDVRRAVAEHGYGLDVLINDKNWYIQNKAVAKQNGGLMIPISSGISPAQDTKKEKKKWLNFWKK